MKKVAFASYIPDYDEFTYHYEDQRLLSDALAIRGVAVETVPWEREDVDWTQYEAVIIRSTWNYHLHYPQFLAWLARLEQQQVRVLNPISMLRWNMDKTYIGELTQYGIRTLPTEYYQQGQTANLSDILSKNGWTRGVVKPTVSAGGDNTWRFSADTVAEQQAVLDTQLQQMTVMIQQYADNIAEGEWSFLFFNGVYSHAVLKKPATGDMFVHQHRGGSTEPASPPHHLVGQASNMVRVIEKITGTLPLYARIDAVIQNDSLILMELELLEPYFYIPYGDAYTTERIADAIAQRV